MKPLRSWAAWSSLLRMTWKVLALDSVLVWLVFVLGCAPVAMNNLDEEKDPHFISGKNKISGYDYNGAVEAFEKALETNPHSASAHFEIGLLYYQKLNDFAAAIYHFEKFLKLNPKHSRAETVKQFVIASKQELARTVSLGPTNLQVQKELDRLISTNQVLLVENNRFRDQLQQLQAEISQLKNSPSPSMLGQPMQPQNQGPGQSKTHTPSTGAAPLVQINTATNDPRGVNAAGRSKPSAEPGSQGDSKTTPKVRTYVIVAGDTPAKIGRRYNMSYVKILGANPGLDPRKLRVGTTIKIPEN